MERRVTTFSEFVLATVNDIRSIESQTLNGVSTIKVYFQPGTNMGSAIAQMSANNNSILRQAPPGITPPSILPFNASNVPVIQMTMSSKTMSEQQIQDIALDEMNNRFGRVQIGWPISRMLRGRRDLGVSEADHD